MDGSLYPGTNGASSTTTSVQHRCKAAGSSPGLSLSTQRYQKPGHRVAHLARSFTGQSLCSSLQLAKELAVLVLVEVVDNLAMDVGTEARQLGGLVVNLRRTLYAVHRG